MNVIHITLLILHRMAAQDFRNSAECSMVCIISRKCEVGLGRTMLDCFNCLSAEILSCYFYSCQFIFSNNIANYKIL